MLVRIPAADATVGMFVEKIECSWWAHPFWRSRQILVSEEQLAMLHQSGAEFIVINAEKGSIGSKTRADIKERAGQSVVTQIVVPQQPTYEKCRPRAQPFIQTSRLSEKDRRAEVTKARNVLSRSKKAVRDMFDNARMGEAIQTRKMASMVNQLTASLDKDPTIILNMARLKTKDDYTYLHSVSVCALMINLARAMRLDETLVREAGMAGLLHDVGKLAIPNEILLKPSKLDDAEFQIVRDHPLAGYKILAASTGVSAAALDVCLHHHEKMDGTGYPDKLNGDELSLLTRMASICDVYDAITSQRAYNCPWTPSDALSRMQSWDGHFDQMILRSFIESLKIIPIGTLVRLTNDHLAVVTGETASDYSLPKVRIFYSIEKSSRTGPHDIEISRSRHCWKILSIEDPLDWGFDKWGQMQTEIIRQTAPSMNTSNASVRN
jgi:HD-GYP domain-containing protein (c-di-GMP phosphodiesterase class II)